jgi:hypothetical protein
MELKLNTLAGTIALLYAFGLPTYLLVFHENPIEPFVSLILSALILLAFGIFFGCFHTENPNSPKVKE